MYLKKWAFLLIIVITVCGMTACGNKQGQDNQAVSSTEAAAEWKTQYDLGYRLISEGNYEEAILAFQAAIKIDPKKAQAYVQLATAYQASDQDTLAKEILQNGLNSCDDRDELIDAAAQMGYILDANGNFVTEEELLANMTPVERAQYYLDQNEHSFVFDGHIVWYGKSVRDYALEEVRDIFIANGWELEGDIETRDTGSRDLNGVCVGAYLYEDDVNMDFDVTRIVVGSANDNSWRYDKEELSQFFPAGMETGIEGLCFGDSLEDVLRKLGINNAEKVVKAIVEIEEGQLVIDAVAKAENAGDKDWECIDIRVSAEEDVKKVSVGIGANFKTDGVNYSFDQSQVELVFKGPDYLLSGYDIYNMKNEVK